MDPDVEIKKIMWLRSCVFRKHSAKKLHLQIAWCKIILIFFNNFVNFLLVVYDCNKQQGWVGRSDRPCN